MTVTADLNQRVLVAALLGCAVLLGLLAGVSPRAALAAGAGIAFVLLVVADLSLALAVFAVVSFLDVIPTGTGGATFGNVAAGLFVLAWLAAMAGRDEGVRSLFSEHPLLSYLLLLFLAWGSLSLIFAENSAAGVEALKSYALNLLLFVIAFTALRTRDQVIRVVAALIVGAVIAACLGIASPPEQETSFTDVSRLAGGSLGANELAATLVAGLALAFAFLAGWRDAPVVRLLALLAMAVCLLGIVLSVSRGGLVALAVALVAASILGGRHRAAAVALLVTAAVASVGYFSYVATPDARDRITESDTSGTGRTDIWAVGWRMVEDKPVSGVGIGNFADSSIHYLLEPGALQRDEFIVDEPKVAHNIYLEVLAELGVVGLVLFLSIIGTAMGCLWRAVRGFKRVGDGKLEILSRSVLVALIALLAADFFISDQFSKVLWLLLALGPSLLAISRAAESRPAQRERWSASSAS